MTSNTAVRFALVGLLGWIVDLTLFQALWRAGLGLSVAHLSSFFVAAATNFVLNSRWAFYAATGGRLDWLGFSRFLTVSLLALFLRGGVLAAGHERLGLSWPEAPLVARWGGEMLFFECALLAEKRLAWWGVGACLGLGMLSKYTIVLLAAAALAFLLLDRRSRRWLARPEPYAATLLTSLLLLPVIVWNVHNGWASFAFQSTRRMTEPPTLGLHVLIASILVLLTPVGAIAAIAAIVQRRGPPHDRYGESAAARQRLFTTVLTLVPLAVFVLFSLRHEPKLNWTGPLWLAVLPAIARQLPGDGRRTGWGFGALARRSWPPALVATLLLFGALLHYVTIGLPGAPHSARGSLPIAWEELGREVAAIEDALEGPLTEVPDQETLVVGMDKYFLASVLAFYRRDGGAGSEHTASRHLFGRNGLMYASWFPAEQQRGRDLLLVSLDRGDLADERLAAWVEHLGPIQTRVIEKHGQPVLRFHFRVAESYRPRETEEASPRLTPPPLLAEGIACLRPPCS